MAKRRNVAYLRVSTEVQLEKFGLDVQRQKITEYCNKHEITIDDWYVDGGYSGAKMERPEINRLLDDAEQGLIDTVYVYKLDRMSRDVIDTLNLMYRVLPAYGVKLVSMTEEIRTENPMDKVMLTMNAAMNQYEREVIRMRMSAGMLERVKKGYWMGGGRVPYGYYYDRNDGILHPNPEEAERVRNAYKLYIDGYSCQRIAEILGFKWEKVVYNVLTRKSNIGLIEYNGKIYQGLHEPIIDTETYYKAMDCMKKRQKKNYIANDNMLTGLCVCGKCGGRMRYQKWGKYHRLVCYSSYNSSKDYMKKTCHCDNIRPRTDAVEHDVEYALRKFVIEYVEDKQKETVDESAIIKKQIEKSKVKQKKFYSMYADNDNATLLELAKEEETKITGLEIRLFEIEQEKQTNKVDDFRKNVVTGIEKWEMLNTKQKNKLLKGCVEKVVITGEDVEVYFTTH
jgi:site-specific DNA recombinase